MQLVFISLDLPTQVLQGSSHDANNPVIVFSKNYPVSGLELIHS